MRIFWSRSAQSDLREATEFIALDSPSAADAIEDRLLAAIEGLVDHPEKGRSGLRAGTRELVVARTPYLVVYRLVAGDIELARIWHTSRRPFGDPAE